MSGKLNGKMVNTIMPFESGCISCVDTERKAFNELSDEEVLEQIRNLTMAMGDTTLAHADALIGVAMSRESISPLQLQEACQDAEGAYQTMFAGQTCPIRFPDFD